MNLNLKEAARPIEDENEIPDGRYINHVSWPKTHLS